MLKVYVINLEHHVERRQKIINQFKQLGIKDVEIIKGVDGKKINKSKYNNDPKKTYEFISRPLSSTEIGCTLSHITVYKDIIKKNIDLAIVLEDDVIITDLLMHKYDIEDSDVVLIGSTAATETNEGHKLYDIGLWGTISGSYAYIITNAGAIKMVNYFQEINHPIDSWNILRRHGIIIKKMIPSSVYVDHTSKSYIEEDRILAKSQSSDFKKSIFKK